MHRATSIAAAAAATATARTVRVVLGAQRGSRSRSSRTLQPRRAGVGVQRIQYSVARARDHGGCAVDAGKRRLTCEAELHRRPVAGVQSPHPAPVRIRRVHAAVHRANNDERAWFAGGVLHEEDESKPKGRGDGPTLHMR